MKIQDRIAQLATLDVEVQHFSCESRAAFASDYGFVVARFEDGEGVEVIAPEKGEAVMTIPTDGKLFHALVDQYGKEWLKHNHVGGGAYDIIVPTEKHRIFDNVAKFSYEFRLPHGDIFGRDHMTSNTNTRYFGSKNK